MCGPKVGFEFVCVCVSAVEHSTCIYLFIYSFIRFSLLLEQLGFDNEKLFRIFFFTFHFRSYFSMFECDKAQKMEINRKIEREITTKNMHVAKPKSIREMWHWNRFPYMSPPDTVRFGRILLSFFNPSFAYAIQPGSENSKKKKYF